MNVHLAEKPAPEVVDQIRHGLKLVLSTRWIRQLNHMT